MNLLLYDAHWKALGGGEKYLVQLARALSTRHNVTLLLKDVTLDDITHRFGITPGFFVAREGTGREANIVLSNDRPFGKKLAYVVQIPFEPIHAGEFLGRHPLKLLRHMRQRRVLWNAKRSEIVLAYSQFVADHLKRYGIDAIVLSPAVDDFKSDLPKKNVILSVGRFFKTGFNAKRYDAMIDAFKIFSKDHPDWEYRIVGGVGPEVSDYVHELLLRAAGFPIRFCVNVPYSELALHYAEAKIFWHGAGYGAKIPEECEHFGISTLEAMSAGCIPVVVNNGGQAEIIQKTGSGYFWYDPLGLATITSSIIGSVNQAWFEAVHHAARKRYEDFTFEKFRERALTIFSPFEVEE